MSQNDDGVLNIYTGKKADKPEKRVPVYAVVLLVALSFYLGIRYNEWRLEPLFEKTYKVLSYCDSVINSKTGMPEELLKKIPGADVI